MTGGEHDGACRATSSLEETKGSQLLTAAPVAGAREQSSEALGAKYMISKKSRFLVPVLYSKLLDVSLKAVVDAKKMGEFMEVLPCPKGTEITSSGEPLR